MLYVWDCLGWEVEGGSNKGRLGEREVVFFIMDYEYYMLFGDLVVFGELDRGENGWEGFINFGFEVEVVIVDCLGVRSKE